VSTSSNRYSPDRIFWHACHRWSLPFELDAAGSANAPKSSVALGGLRAYGAKAHKDVVDRAEQLRPVFKELAGLSARKIASVLNGRKVVNPTRGAWHAATVIRAQKRLGVT
jgi:hypothetical protein